MTWDRLVLGIDDVLGVLLIARLLSLRLQRVYLFFCAIVALQIAASLVLIFQILVPGRLDYRISWLFFTIVSWALLLGLVYALLSATLESLPGVLHFSRKLLNLAFAIAAVIAIASVRPDGAVFSGKHTLESAVRLGLVLDRAVSTTALLVLLGILAFVLWFPVELPRNLAIFSFGLVIYFAIDIVVMLIHEIAPGISSSAISAIDTSLIGASYLYWSVSVTRRGERASLRLGHGWQPSEQHRLVEQLENMNEALLRGGRR